MDAFLYWILHSSVGTWTSPLLFFNLEITIYRPRDEVAHVFLFQSPHNRCVRFHVTIDRGERCDVHCWHGTNSLHQLRSAQLVAHMVWALQGHAPLGYTLLGTHAQGMQGTRALSCARLK